MRACLIAIAVIFASAPAAVAEIKASAPDSFQLEFKGAIPLARAEAWARVVAVPKWWSDAHTYSGKASNMSLEAKAGGCWCEAWDAGQVEHGRVLALMNGSLLRLDAALGPLQDMGVKAVLTLTLSDGADDGSTEVTMTYRVNGASSSDLAAIATPVHQVMSEQFARLIAP